MEKMKWLKSDNSLFVFNRNIISKYRKKDYGDVDDDDDEQTQHVFNLILFTRKITTFSANQFEKKAFHVDFIRI